MSSFYTQVRVGNVTQLDFRHPWTCILAPGTTVDNTGTTVTDPYNVAQVAAAVFAQTTGVAGAGRLMRTLSPKGSLQICTFGAHSSNQFTGTIWRVGHSVDGPYTISVDGFPVVCGVCENVCRQAGLAEQAIAPTTDIQRLSIDTTTGYIEPHTGTGGTAYYMSDIYTFDLDNAAFVFPTVKVRTTDIGVMARLLPSEL